MIGFTVEQAALLQALRDGRYAQLPHTVKAFRMRDQFSPVGVMLDLFITSGRTTAKWEEHAFFPGIYIIGEPGNELADGLAIWKPLCHCFGLTKLDIDRIEEAGDRGASFAHIADNLERHLTQRRKADTRLTPGVIYAYTAKIEQDEEGRFLVTFPSFGWGATDGATREEALQEAKDLLREIAMTTLIQGRSLPADIALHLERDISDDPSYEVVISDPL